MRVLLVTNTTEKCGVAQWGRRMFSAARIAGWNIDQQGPELPRTLDSWDVIFFNWHGVTLGDIPLDSLVHTPSTKLAGYFHEITPRRVYEAESLPALWKVADMRLIAEAAGPSVRAFPPPAPDYDYQSLFPATYPVRIGNSGIRKVGLDWIEPVCARRGWELDVSTDVWLSDTAEIERLSRCTLNVAHYHSADMGSSQAVMTMVAAGRPLLVNSCGMLRWIGQWAQETDMPPQVYLDDDFERGVETILKDIENKVERRPCALARRFAWSQRIKVLKMHLESLFSR